MVSSLSSFLEVFFALYMSIYFDDKIGLKIWTPDYSPALRNFLLQNELWKDAGLKEKVHVCVQENLRKAYSAARMMSLLLFVFTLLLLVYIGFENTQEDDSGNCSIGTAMIFDAILFIVFAASMTCALWSRKLLLCIFYRIVFFCGSDVLAISYFRIHIPDAIFSPLICRVLLVCVLVAPMIYHVLWCLLMKKKYFSYIERYLSLELRCLNDVSSQREKIDKDDYNEHGVSGVYDEVMYKIYKSEDPSEDANLEELAESFQNKFRKECPVPSLEALFCVKSGERTILNSRIDEKVIHRM